MIDPDAARRKADELQALHDRYDSWRKVTAKHYPDVPPGTLNRIAKSGGAYLPKDRKLLRSLGLMERRRKRSELEKRISRMARETKRVVLVVRRK